MNRLLLFLLFYCFLSPSLQAQVLWRLTTDSVQTFYYAGGDEFNTLKVDEAIWNHHPDWGSAAPKQSLYYTPGNNVYLLDGKAHLLVKKENYQGHVYPWEVDSAWVKKKKRDLGIVNDEMSFHYTAAALWSKKRYKYGYFECRFKTTDEHGVWPAFWLYANHKNDEIDWFELKGERPDQIHVDMHCPDGCANYRGGFMKLKKNWGGWLKASDSLSEGYNIISGLWTKDYIIWYLNGQPLSSAANRYEHPMQVIVNTSLAADNEAFGPGPDASTVFPNDLVVDYVRVWTADVISEFPAVGDQRLYASELSHADSLTKAKVKKVQNFIYDRRLLAKEWGTVTLFPMGGKYFRLSANGPQLGVITLKVVDQQGQLLKQEEFGPISDATIPLTDLPDGLYTLKISVKGRELQQLVRIFAGNSALEKQN